MDRPQIFDRLNSVAASGGDVFAALRELPVDVVADLMLEVPDGYAELQAAVPTMAADEVQDFWTGNHGHTLLFQSCAFTHSIETAFLKYGGRPLRDATILDYGCGWGRLLRLMYAFTGPNDLYGCDPWAESIKLCQDAGIAANLDVCDYLPQSAPFDRQFDLIYAFSVFTHLSRNTADTVLAALRKCIAPDGMLAITIRPMSYWDVHHSNSPVDLDKMRELHQANEYAFTPHRGHGDSDVVDADGLLTYGDASFSLEYIQRTWQDWRLLGWDINLLDSYQMVVFLAPTQEPAEPHQGRAERIRALAKSPQGRRVAVSLARARGRRALSGLRTRAKGSGANGSAPSTEVPANPARVASETARAARPADSMSGINVYSSYLSDDEIAQGVHRAQIGGMWQELGEHQFDFLLSQGLQPEHRLLDVGCGAMRGGIHFARYLQPAHYYGVDVNERLIEAALRVEIPAADLSDRVPPENLRVTASFDTDFGVNFEFALAQSLFSHLPLNYIRLCLEQVAKVMAPGGRFFATFFRVPDDVPYGTDYDQVATTSSAVRDPFHYRVRDLEWAATEAGWEFRHVGQWGHPRGQEILELTWPA